MTNDKNIQVATIKRLLHLAASETGLPEDMIDALSDEACQEIFNGFCESQAKEISCSVETISDAIITSESKTPALALCVYLQNNYSETI